MTQSRPSSTLIAVFVLAAAALVTAAMSPVLHAAAAVVA